MQKREKLPFNVSQKKSKLLLTKGLRHVQLFHTENQRAQCLSENMSEGQSGAYTQQIEPALELHILGDNLYH